MVRFESKEKIFDFAIFSLAFILLSVFIKPKKEGERIIGFASAYFSGNIEFLYSKLTKSRNVKVLFVTGEKKEIERTRRLGVNSHYYMDVRSIGLYLRTHGWITSHGANYIPFFGLILRILPSFKWRHHSKWIDVWHGLAWVHTERGKMLRNYDLAFSTSDFFKRYYSQGNNNIAKKIKITGYPRNDPLIDERWSKKEIERDLGIPSGRKNIIYAPTWGHGLGKKLFPWGDTFTFLSELEKFCERNRCNFLIRMHPNWYMQDNKRMIFLETALKNSKTIFHFPICKYVCTEHLLFISDVLITGWSSVANDFLLLNRPMLFLETEFPVEKFVLTPEDRAGYIVGELVEFFVKLHESITKPDLFEEKRKKMLGKLHKYLDGRASERCVKEILHLLNT